MLVVDLLEYFMQLTNMSDSLIEKGVAKNMLLIKTASFTK